MNDSATGGYLQPIPGGPEPIYDNALDDFLQQVVVGITGLSGPMVRPRWQPDTPNLPPVGTAWAAIGVTEFDQDTYAAMVHKPDANDGEGADSLERHELCMITVSFYGPTASALCAKFSDGLQVAQNREVLVAAGFGLVEVTNPMVVPALIKDQWQRRVDIQMLVRRAINRLYPILNLLSAEVVLTTDNEAAGQVAFATGRLYATYSDLQTSSVMVRRNGSEGAVGASIVPAGGTAVIGVDYQLSVEEFVWADSDSTPKPFTIHFLDGWQGSKTIVLALLADDGTTAGAPTTLVVAVSYDPSMTVDRTDVTCDSTTITCDET